MNNVKVKFHLSTGSDITIINKDNTWKDLDNATLTKTPKTASDLSENNILEGK